MMRKPGFSGEASLYDTSVRYREDRTTTAPTSGAGIVPQHGQHCVVYKTYTTGWWWWKRNHYCHACAGVDCRVNLSCHEA